MNMITTPLPLPRNRRGYVAMVTTTPSLSQQRKGTCKNDHHSPSPSPRRALGYVAMITTAPSLSQKRKDMCGYDQHHASHRRTIIYGHDHHPFFSHERKRPSAGRQGSDLARRRPSPGLSSKLGLSSPSQKRKGAYGHDHHPVPFPEEEGDVWP